MSQSIKIYREFVNVHFYLNLKNRRKFHKTWFYVHQNYRNLFNRVLPSKLQCYENFQFISRCCVVHEKIFCDCFANISFGSCCRRRNIFHSIRKLHQPMFSIVFISRSPQNEVVTLLSQLSSDYEGTCSAVLHLCHTLGNTIITINIAQLTMSNRSFYVLFSLSYHFRALVIKT